MPHRHGTNQTLLNVALLLGVVVFCVCVCVCVVYFIRGIPAAAGGRPALLPLAQFIMLAKFSAALSSLLFNCWHQAMLGVKVGFKLDKLDVLAVHVPQVC